MAVFVWRKSDAHCEQKAETSEEGDIGICHVNDVVERKKESRATTDTASDASLSVITTFKGPAELFPDDCQNTSEENKMTKGKIAVIMTALCLATFLAALDMVRLTRRLYELQLVDEPLIKGSVRRLLPLSYPQYLGHFARLRRIIPATPIWGKVSDIFGRKPVLLAANVVFLIGSLLCAISINIRMLIGGRCVQGVGGGGLLALVNISIGDLFSMRSRGVYFGIIGMVWAVAGAVGPVVGGIMTQFVTWRWCFYINLPVDGIAFVIIFFFFEVHTPKTPLFAGLRAIDWLGSLTIVGGTVMFLLGLEYGGVWLPWASVPVVCLIAFGIGTLGLFLLIQWKLAYYPIIPLWLFSSRSTVAAYGMIFAQGFVYTGGSYFLPLYFQVVLGATPLQSGIYLFPFVISVALVAAISGYLIRKTGLFLPPIWAGMATLVLGVGLYIDLPAHTSWARIITYQLVAGIGVGPNFQAPLIALQSHLRPFDSATATATAGFVRNMANSVSVVLGGVIFQNQTRANIRSLGSILSPETADMLQGRSVSASTDFVKTLPNKEKIPALNAYNQSLRVMWIFYTSMAAIGLCVSLLIRRHNLDIEHEITETGLEIQERERQERLRREKMKPKRKRTTDKEGLEN
ncbi:Major Facilitator Superfamily protein [Coccidioides posadasii C735 delta SOWgp]|uniref:Major Facilitator Superfamily protein n=1 Tax=Coccidioides posadasii (strain C735) TaxID=222929 RepID=C5PIC9_COCP7|nr:Major Facilitator Superfamily protein [Coccidioides posadasii C735 delta SOWgp]EER24282.1 Major Facilitator Superfamily protein [Coccidioides posadasii C735 delta SOWgp]|eukprot:XP_003066427.1 Major Facilitator Superfamily protein [Coccidioides posadasii C735 delta SOWgp]